jgi:hypothetical protein
VTNIYFIFLTIGFALVVFILDYVVNVFDLSYWLRRIRGYRLVIIYLSCPIHYGLYAYLFTLYDPII